MPTSERFEELYKKLNKEQKKAVDTIDGPVMVIAGPGTGKTQILTLRIAHILKKTDTSPDSILALTFTESASYSMRKRLVEIIGSAAYKINIFTFHSFCNEIIKAYPEEFPRIIGANNITDIDQIRIMEQVIMSLELVKLKPYGDQFYYLRPALQEIRDLKRDDIDPEQFAKLVKAQEKEFKSIDDLYYDKGAYKGKMKGKYKDLEKHIEKNTDLLEIYKAYEKALEKERLYDYEDMIMEVIRVLKKNDDLLLRLQEKYQYVLADEHQDANNAQNKILELLSSFHENPNLFIVGDEKQAIFRFQGASLENFLYFKKLYPKAVLISLVENYRSTQAILDGSHSLISKNKVEDEKLRVELKANTIHLDEKIKLYAFTKAEYEYLFLINDIEKKIKAGVKPYEIVILYRNNNDVFPIIKALEKTTIPFSVESGQDVLSDEDISKIVLTLRAVNDLGNNELLYKLFFIDYFGLNSLDIYKVMNFARAQRTGLFEIIKSEELLGAANVEGKNTFLDLYKKISAWSILAKNKNIVDFFEIIVRESGFLDHIIALSGSLDKLSKLDVFFSEIKKVAENHKEYKLNNLIDYLDTLNLHNVLIKVESKGTVAHGVRLMTAHRSKGMEFDYVYVVGVCDGHWSNKRQIMHFKVPKNAENKKIEFDVIDDERRLFYVALTRARKEVTLTYAQEGLNKEHQLPAQFIDEIDQKLLEKIDASKLENILKENRTFAFLPKLNAGIDLKDKNYLKQLFLEQGLSVTALNNFLKCPWDYFFQNLLRIPRPQTKHQLYGTAMHEVLKVFFDKYKTEEDLSKKELLELFEDYLRRKPFAQNDFNDSLKKGKEALGGYYDAYKKSWPRNLVTEFAIGGVHIPVKLESGETVEILLRGNLDKIQYLEGNKVSVVDYKTKQPVSRNELEGKTKNSRGDIKRQLVFYKMLLDKYEEGKYSMQSGEIDFIEPDSSGNYKKEAFVITNEEVQELEKLIQDTSKKILTFEFWGDCCDDKDCEFCGYRKMLEKVTIV